MSARVTHPLALWIVGMATCAARTRLYSTLYNLSIAAVPPPPPGGGGGGGGTERTPEH